MAYDEKLADKIREALSGTKKVLEKKMFGGIAFMINEKMCIGVDKEDLIIRCLPEQTDDLLEKTGARPFDLSGNRTMKGWLLVSPDGFKSKKDFSYWLNICLDSNSKAMAIKKAKKK